MSENLALAYRSGVINCLQTEKRSSLGLPVLYGQSSSALKVIFWLVAAKTKRLSFGM